MSRIETDFDNENEKSFHHPCPRQYNSLHLSCWERRLGGERHCQWTNHWRWSLIGCLLLWLIIAPTFARAHPLDEYYQVTTINVAPNRVTLSVELYPAVLIAPQLLPLIDADENEQISETEQTAYIDFFRKQVQLQVDGQTVELTPANIQFPSYLDIQAGGSVIRFDLFTDLPADHRGDHQLSYQNDHWPDSAIYVVQPRSELPDWVYILDFERDILQQSIQVNYSIDPAAPVEHGVKQAISEVAGAETTTIGQEQLSRYLYADLSPLWVTVAIGLSIVLGALHALTPGHGKTLVAAYLIGSRGTLKHAVYLGGIVTFTHTASVILIGLLALLASQFIVPTLLVPILEISSGLLVVYLGIRLLWDRWAAYQHDAAHHHHHSHDHDHHHHHIPEGVKMRDLLTLGVSGGLVPCPEALGIMLIAIGLNRILLGLGMIVAFSFGLAAILIIIGILLVRSKSLLERVSGAGGRWQTVLPLVSAVIVTVLGLGIVAKGVWPFWLG